MRIISRYLEHQNIYFMAGGFVNMEHCWTVVVTSIVDTPLTTSKCTNVIHSFQLFNQNTGSVKIEIESWYEYFCFFKVGYTYLKKICNHQKIKSL